MNILIINNGTKHIKEIKNILSKYNLTTINRKDLSTNYNNFDLIILSGSLTLPVINHKNEYEKELDIIKNSNIPIIGICLGFQLICYAFNENIELLKKRRKGLIRVHKIYDDVILNHINKHFYVFNSHRWGVKKLNYLIPLARSKDGIEIVKHPFKKIYGLQFHPEVFNKKNKGYLILENIILNINKF